MNQLTFDDFSKINRLRTESVVGFNHPLRNWSLLEWSGAMSGEAGEACNCAKKILRLQQGIDKPSYAGLDEDIAHLRIILGKEIADTVTYADLCAQAAGLQLSDTLVNKFNEVSTRRKLAFVIE